MRKIIEFLIAVTGTIMLLGLAGCFGKIDKVITNYYVLDYQKSSEDLSLQRPKNTGKILEVLDAYLPRTYDRNQIVVKENFYRIRYLQTDVWASKLRDAIPNLIMHRLRAYNIFSQISRGDQGDLIPHYYLETNVLNIEKVEGTVPRAYIRMEFVLRDSTSQKIVFNHKNERYKDLSDPSMVYLIQAFNDMIMEETNIFAAKCNLHFSGKQIQDPRPQAATSHIENYYYEKMAQSAAQITYGELSVNTKTPTEEQITYIIEGLDSLNTVITRDEWLMNKALTLTPGRYRVTLGESQELSLPVEIKPRQRSVLNPEWGELQVVIIDESQTRVRTGYDIWIRDQEGIGFVNYSGTVFSMGDDEIGAIDKLWILPSGSYLIKLGGGSWNELRNFATVSLAKGERKTLTIVVDPNSDTDFFVGAGVFADEDLGYGSKRIHKGAIHGNINLSSNNNVDKNKPNTSLTIAAQLENNVDIKDRIKPFHFTMRSLYDLGLNITTGSDFRFNLDDYTLKSVLLLYPFEQKPVLRNFAFYGRADQSTHFFDETTFFSENKNYVLLNKDNIETQRELDKPSLKTKIALYPLRMKEGTGITYRIYMGSNSWVSLRGGYGMQQDYNKLSYIYRYTQKDIIDGVERTYDYYVEDSDRSTKGIESTVILSVVNLLKFVSVNSTLDVLFPMGVGRRSYHLENENRVNLRLYRNISVDFRLNILYDKDEKPWVVYDSSSYLRLSLYY